SRIAIDARGDGFPLRCDLIFAVEAAQQNTLERVQNRNHRAIIRDRLPVTLRPFYLAGGAADHVPQPHWAVENVTTVAAYLDLPVGIVIENPVVELPGLRERPFNKIRHIVATAMKRVRTLYLGRLPVDNENLPVRTDV